MDEFKAGAFKKQYQYNSFSPNLVNVPLAINDADVHLLLSEANRLLGELNAYSSLIPNIDFFIKMHVVKEATQSSKIEGTKTEFDEALLEESEIDPERRDDWEEVQNYTRAMNFAIEKLKDLPISMRLLKETHKILLSGVRGEMKSPGEIRDSQNWIGGSSLSDAFFIPPHKNELPDLLTDLEKFWHNEDLKIPELIKAAIGHYQFETIHPFLDGNGRIGRLLITLYLIDKKIMSRPTLYLSDFFAKNKGQYYDALTMVRHSNDILSWIKFFLNGVITTAKNSKKTFEQIIEISSRYDEKILTLGKRAENARELISFMYSRPILDVNRMAKKLDVSHQSANNLVKKMEEMGILKEVTGGRRNRLFALIEYLNLFH